MRVRDTPLCRSFFAVGMSGGVACPTSTKQKTVTLVGKGNQPLACVELAGIPCSVLCFCCSESRFGEVFYAHHT